MLNCLLDEGQFVMVSSLMMSETAHLREDVACEDVAKDRLENDSPSSSIILEIDLFLLILFERIAYKKYEIEKFVKKYDCKKVQNSYYSN